MNILGISCFYHDAAVALLRDGMLVAAAEEERFTRKKHDYSFPKRAIEFCLQQAQIASGDLDYVVFYEKPLVKFERILMTCLGAYPKTWRVFREAMITWFNEKLWIKGLLVRHLGLPENKILFAPHHMSHAASALYCSPFKESAILTIDGVGEWTTATIGRGTADWNTGAENAMDLFGEIRFPHSLGLLYSAFTAFLGFEVNEGEYKVMGMAPYGEPRYMDEVYKLIQVGDDGSFHLNMEYFSFYHSTDHTFNQRFVDLFGTPRKRESEFYTATTHPQRDHPKWDNQVAADNQKYADIAASIQRVTEDIILKMANHVQRVTGSKNLCMAGGVALNSVANGRILRETEFEDVFIQPAAGDSGGALGAALYTYHILLKKPRKFVLENCYWGAGYSNSEIVDALQSKGLAFEEISDDNCLVERVADGLTQGKVVGWFQGRFEWGPRALGNRSILADPRRAEMKGIVNEKIKFREPFRPFAPVILEERTQEYLALSEPQRHYPARFMLLVAPIHPDKQDVIPAVNHLGTGRLQTIRRDINPRYYGVVEKFGAATGVPVLMNTSFNLRGEPIVGTPANAIWTFTNSGLDWLVMENFLVTKKI
ncbi:MAG: carbamoyltransferase [Chloroflexi bacterium]|nr:carbamoyltransferase [Chloroflexota bacterium]